MQVSDILKRVFWLFLCASAALAIFRGLPPNPGDWYGWAEKQLVDVQQWVTGIGDDVNTWIDKQPDPKSILPSSGEKGSKKSGGSGASEDPAPSTPADTSDTQEQAARSK